MKHDARHYLMLLTISKTSELSPDLLPHITRITKEPPALLWQCDTAIAIGLVTACNARTITHHMRSATLPGVRNFLIAQMGRDWCAMADSRADGWMVRHLGDPES